MIGRIRTVSVVGARPLADEQATVGQTHADHALESGAAQSCARTARKPTGAGGQASAPTRAHTGTGSVDGWVHVISIVDTSSLDLS